MSKKEYIFSFLTESQVRQVRPEIACELGVPEAFVLDQIRYWVTNPANTNIHEGRRWVYKSFEEWQLDFPFYSLNTIKRAIKKLEDSDYVLSSNFHKNKFNRCKWYTLNHKLSEVTNNNPSTQNESMESIKMRQDSVPKCVDPSTQNESIFLKEEYITKNTTKNKTRAGARDSHVLEGEIITSLSVESNNVSKTSINNRQEGLKSSILEVFEYWQVQMDPEAEMKPERAKIISEALAGRNSVEKLKKAILGCTRTPWFMDQNLTQLKHIFKDQQTIDMFVKNADKPPKVPMNPNSFYAVRHSAHQAAMKGHEELRRKLEARAARQREKEIEEERRRSKEESNASICGEVARIEQSAIERTL